MSENSNDFFDLDLAVMDDDALVVLAKECAHGPARDELILRYSSQRDRLVSWLAHSTQFKAVDIEDARQNAIFWTVEAIQKYDTEQIAKDQGCSFFSFLNRVLVCRFKDYAKHVRRREKHYERAPAQEQEPARTGRESIDPAAAVEYKESQTRLYAAIARLDGESCRVWELLSEGHSLREISAELGISYDAAKRRRRKLIEYLKTQLCST